MTSDIERILGDRMELFDKYLDRGKLTHQQYQKDGVKFMLNNELREDPVCGVRGGFIADEMGLGKTIMMIGVMLCNFVERTLIIVPPVLVDQWYVQIARTTGHKALIFHGDNKKQITASDLAAAKIVISTYGAITMTQTMMKEKTVTPLHRIVWSRIIFDEAHHLRNGNTNRNVGARILSAKIRWLVSGTPIQNRKRDFYNMCNIIGLPASYYTNFPQNQFDFQQKYLLKRTKSQVGIDLPPIQFIHHNVEWTHDSERKLSNDIHRAVSFRRDLKLKMIL